MYTQALEIGPVNLLVKFSLEIPVFKLSARLSYKQSYKKKIGTAEKVISYGNRHTQPRVLTFLEIGLVNLLRKFSLQIPIFTLSARTFI